MTTLTLNVLEFVPVETHVTVFVRKEQSVNSFRLSDKDCKGLMDSGEVMYGSFESTGPDCQSLTRPTSPASCRPTEQAWSISLLKKYFTYRLTGYFRGLGLPAFRNFVGDAEVWVPDRSPYTGCDGYRAFTLRIMFSSFRKQYELLISMGDVHSVYRKPISDSVFNEADKNLIRKVMFEQQVWRKDDLPERARRHPELLFPCISFTLLAYLHIPRPAPDKTNRYLKFRAAIEQFRTDFLSGEDVGKFMQAADAWQTRESAQLDMSSMQSLQFGEGNYADIYQGFRKYGPLTTVDEELFFFFIMHKEDMPLSLTIHDYLSGVHPDFKGGLSAFLQMKYNTENKLSILFENRENPLPEIAARLQEREFDLIHKRYVAIYLSPYSKWTTSGSKKRIYYRLKEMLLERGVVSQTIEVEKTWGNERKTEMQDRWLKAILKPGFHFSLPNILVAICAKAGGVPWGLANSRSEELVIGISAYKNRDVDDQYLGSAFSFTGEGRFQGFDCFRSTQLKELVGSISLAVREYASRENGLQRLVIHFYKRLSRKELKPLEQALASLGLAIPVIVVSVNKNFSDDIVGFDDAHSHLMPLTGSWLSLEQHQYLLYNNPLNTTESAINAREGYPFPLKLTIEKYAAGDSEVLAPDANELDELLLQICRFSRLYWKSVSRQWVPVTLRYPEMLAQMVPYFQSPDLNKDCSDRLWFL